MNAEALKNTEKLKIEAEVKNIKGILVNDEVFYQIPDYQRPYSWDKDNLSDLIDDLTDAYFANKDKNYFCGSLVLVNNEYDGRFDIIDGQQRITTFTILACIFRDIYLNNLTEKAKKYINLSIKDEFEEDKQKLKLLTYKDNESNFSEIVLNEINFTACIKGNKYLENACYLKDFLAEAIDEKGIHVNDFVMWFYENVVLTVITCPSQDSAMQIFNVLNDRGMPLSPVDILKSKLMQDLQDNKEERRLFADKWDHIREKLKNDSNDYSVFNNMLTTYLYYKVPASSKKSLNEDLLDVFKKEKKKSQDIITEIVNFGLEYEKIVMQEDKYIHCLKNSPYKIYWESILTTAMFSKYKEIEDLKKILVAYYYQNWIAGGTTTRIKQTSFNILKIVKRNETISNVKEEIRKNLDKYKTFKAYEEELVSNAAYKKKWSKPLLMLIEHFNTDSAKPCFEISSKLHIEHILPQTPDNKWQEIFTEEERDTWTHSLANLTLLSTTKNKKASNASFEEKRKVYTPLNNAVTSYTITQEIVNNHKEWNVDALKERQATLVKRVNNKLDILK